MEGVPECVRQAWKKNELMSELAGEILFVRLVNQAADSGGLIVGRKHMGIPRWIKDHFHDLNSLDIRICKLEEKDLLILREMPNLYDLKLRLEVVPREPIAISGEGFRSLGELVVDCRVPRVITFLQGAMRRLYRLVFEFQFYGGPPNKHPMGIKHLRGLEIAIFRCNEEWYGEAAESRSPCMSAMIDVVRKEAQEHPNEISFCVTGHAEETFPAKESLAREASGSGSGAENEMKREEKRSARGEVSSSSAGTGEILEAA